MMYVEEALILLLIILNVNGAATFCPSIRRFSQIASQLMKYIPAILFTESGPNAASHKEVMRLRKENQNMSEENNLLKLKIDILLDMVGNCGSAE